LELLPQPPTHDRVVAVEAHRERLAVEHLLADALVDEPGELLRRGRALPGAGEALGELLEVARREDDAIGPPARRVGEETGDPEDRGADEEEVQQRLAQPPHRRTAPAPRAGATAPPAPILGSTLTGSPQPARSRARADRDERGPRRAGPRGSLPAIPT